MPRPDLSDAPDTVLSFIGNAIGIGREPVVFSVAACVVDVGDVVAGGDEEVAPGCEVVAGVITATRRCIREMAPMQTGAKLRGAHHVENRAAS